MRGTLTFTLTVTLVSFKRQRKVVTDDTRQDTTWYETCLKELPVCSEPLTHPLTPTLDQHSSSFSNLSTFVKTTSSSSPTR